MKHQKVKIFLLMSAMLCWHTTVLADSAQPSATAASDSAAPQQWYACPKGEKQAVYVTEPTDVRCQPAKKPPQPNELASIRSDNEDLQRLWYMREFGHEQDVTILSHSAPAVNVRLRQTPPVKVATTIGKRQAASEPIKRIASPKPLTPKQLIRRDIAKEQWALSVARQQWQQAKKQGHAAKMKQWQQNINDRQANIQALKQELSRY